MLAHADRPDATMPPCRHATMPTIPPRLICTCRAGTYSYMRKASAATFTWQAPSYTSHAHGRHRATSATAMNAVSSRSHAVLSINVFQKKKPPADNTLIAGKLFLVPHAHVCQACPRVPRCVRLVCVVCRVNASSMPHRPASLPHHPLDRWTSPAPRGPRSPTCKGPAWTRCVRWCGWVYLPLACTVAELSPGLWHGARSAPSTPPSRHSGTASRHWQPTKSIMCRTGTPS